VVALDVKVRVFATDIEDVPENVQVRSTVVGVLVLYTMYNRLPWYMVFISVAVIAVPMEYAVAVSLFIAYAVSTPVLKRIDMSPVLLGPAQHSICNGLRPFDVLLEPPNSYSPVALRICQ
jgi:hypothetical protein